VADGGGDGAVDAKPHEDLDQLVAGEDNRS
jgi:hypothetical protein